MIHNGESELYKSLFYFLIDSGTYFST